MRPRLAVLIAVPSLLLVFVIWHLKASPPASGPVAAVATPSPLPTALTSSATPDSGPTAVFAHNLMLRKGPDFRIYVRWLRGNMVRTRRDVNPTFDDPESFFLEIKTGVIRANIGDIGNFLNAGGVANSPLNKHLRFLPTATRSGSRELCTSSFRCRSNCSAPLPQPPTTGFSYTSQNSRPENSIERASRRIAH